MPTVYKLPQAKIDLFSIWEYVSRENLNAADRLLMELEEELTLIATQPLMGQSCDELLPNLRSFIIGNYWLFYSPADDGIILERVIDARRSIDPALFF